MHYLIKTYRRNYKYRQLWDRKKAAGHKSLPRGKEDISGIWVFIKYYKIFLSRWVTLKMKICRNEHSKYMSNLFTYIYPDSYRDRTKWNIAQSALLGLYFISIFGEGHIFTALQVLKCPHGFHFLNFVNSHLKLSSFVILEALISNEWFLMIKGKSTETEFAWNCGSFYECEVIQFGQKMAPFWKEKRKTGKQKSRYHN